MRENAIKGQETQIRFMEEKDCQEVADLEQQCFTVPWSFDSIKQSFANPNGYFFVAEREQKIVGYIGMMKAENEGDILNVAVSTQNRRQGIGTRLMEHLLYFAQEKGIETLFLEVRESNRGAIALYEQKGWKKIGVRKRYYTNPTEDGIVMTVDLTTWKMK